LTRADAFELENLPHTTLSASWDAAEQSGGKSVRFVAVDGPGGTRDLVSGLTKAQCDELTRKLNELFADLADALTVSADIDWSR
jgi:hypothetical protein